MKSEVSTREDFDQKNASDLGQGEKQPSSIGMDELGQCCSGSGGTSESD